MSDDLDLVGSDPPDALRTALRDLIPDYDGPVDPLPRVGVSIRRRRTRRRALFAVGSAAAAVVLVAGVPAVVGGLGPTGGPSGLPAGSAPTDPGPASPLPPPVVHRIARGVALDSPWQVGTTNPGGAARRCLQADGGGFDRDLVCFGDWRPGDPVSWDAQVVRLGGRPVTKVTGVAPAGAATVVVRFAGSMAVPAPAVRTTTDPVARFFAVVLAGDAPVRSVTARRPDGTALGPPVTEPSEPSCRQSRNNACAAPDPTN